MPAMLFPGQELRRAAWNLASDNVRAGEDVLIVASSDQYPEIVEALVTACDAAGAGSVTASVIAAPAMMQDYRHPPNVIAAGERADLTVVATSLRFPRAYDDLSEALFAAGRRQVLINNAPLEDFGRGASLADPADLRARTHALAKAVSGGKQVRVTSPNGTDLTVGICRPSLPLTGHAEEDTGFGSFPSGEAMTSPEEGTAEGVFVADSFGQAVYLNGGGPPLGLLEDPIRLEFRAGRCVKIEGGAAAKRLRAVLDQASDDNAYILAELGLGTNPFAREIGHVENKFRLGTAHIALGDNHLIGWRGAHIYGGTLVSDVHVDLVANNVAIEIDGALERICFKPDRLAHPRPRLGRGSMPET